MEKLTLKEIQDAINGKLILKGNIEEFNNVSTDTRKLKAGDIYIALVGENFNGNNYVKEASEKGAALCIIDEVNFKEEELTCNTSVILTKDTKKALLDLAKYYRSKLDIKVVGITGSTGKTSTKDLTAAVLSDKFKVFKTKGNFNNEIGLPLMIFSLDNSYDIAVLEMGMSNRGEIHNLAYAANPEVSLITNIGISHIENLKTRENILKAKMEITDFYNNDNVLIINNDNDLLSTIENNGYKIVKIGTENELNYNAEGIISNEKEVKFKLKEKDSKEEFDFTINMPGKHNVLNGLLAIACGKEFGLSLEEIQRGILKVEPTSMRLDIEKGDNFTIVNDCYNASPDSMVAALDVLKSLEGKRKIAVLGTMKELGHEAKKAHYDIGKYASENDVDLLVVLGEHGKDFEEGYNNKENFKFFDTKEEAIEFLLENLKKEDVILIKASRSMKFENIVNKLVEYK